MALLFGVLTLTLSPNQVATGLALTHVRHRPLGAARAGLRRTRRRRRCRTLHIPGLSDMPSSGRLLFGQDPLVYLSLRA